MTSGRERYRLACRSAACNLKPERKTGNGERGTICANREDLRLVLLFVKSFVRMLLPNFARRRKTSHLPTANGEPHVAKGFLEV